MKGTRTPLRERVARWLLIVGIFGMLGAPYLGPGVASAGSPIGAPTFQGGLICDNGQILAFIGTLGWGGVYTPATNGSQVFSDSLFVVLYDLRPYPVNLQLTLTQLGNVVVSNTTVEPGNPTFDTIALQPTTAWHDVVLSIGGAKQTFSAATPISLLPPSIANVGGIDLLSLAIISEVLIAFAASVAVCKWMMKRALWAPHFSLLIWGHVILLAIVGFVLLDYQQVDSTFAGASPLVYVFAVTPMFFASTLSYFNTSVTAIILRPNAPLAGRLNYHAWYAIVGEDPRGRKTLIQPTWSGFWARFFGHHVVLSDAESGITRPEPFEATIIPRGIAGRREMLAMQRSRLKRGIRFRIAQRVRRPSPHKATPLDDFRVHPAYLDGRPHRAGVGKLPKLLYWTPTGQPVDVEWPRLSFHKVVTVPAKVHRSGEIVIPEHTETRLTAPHYTEGKSNIVLNSMHYRSAQSVVAGWRETDGLSKNLADTSLDLEALKSNFETEVQKKVRERLTARDALLGRTADDLDEAEAAQEAERSRDSLPPLDDLFGRGPVLPDGLDARERQKRVGRRE